MTGVRAVYAELAHRPIERACTQLTECCRFKLTGQMPYVTAAEALVLAKGWRASGRTRVAVSDTPDGACPALDPLTGKCRVYESRPFACRTHFCAAAGGPYARRDVVDLIRRLEDLSAALGSREARPLTAALAERL